MKTDERAERLHDQATRGKTLSPEEQQELQAWYAEQDRAEFEALGFSGHDATIRSLTIQIETAARQLAILTQRIQDISEENERLKRDNAALRHQIVSYHSPKRSASVVS